MIPIKIFSLLFYSWFTLELTFAPPRNGKVILFQRFHEKDNYNQMKGFSS